MKLTKLSMAALMAMGTLSVANAKPLEEAIKGVEFSGMARFRVHDINDGDNDAVSDSNDIDMSLHFEVPIDENMKFVTTGIMAGDDKDSRSSMAGSSGGGVGGDDENEFRMEEMYWMYTNGGFIGKVGRQKTGLPVVDNGHNGDRADGVSMRYDFSFPMSVTGAFYNTSNFMTNGNNIMKFVGNGAGFDNGEDEADRGDIGAVGIAGSMGPVNAKVVGMTMDDVIKAQYFTQLDATFGGFTIRGQGIMTEVDDDTFGTSGNGGGYDYYRGTANTDQLADDTGLFLAMDIKFKYDWFGMRVGGTMNDEDQPIHGLTNDGDTDVINGGWRMGYHDLSYMGGDSYFVDVDMTFGKYKLMAGYAFLEQEGDSDIDSNFANKDEEITEFYGGVAYKYSKNLNTYVKYSDMSADKNDNNEKKYLRFEAKYSF